MLRGHWKTKIIKACSISFSKDALLPPARQSPLPPHTLRLEPMTLSPQRTPAPPASLYLLLSPPHCSPPRSNIQATKCWWLHMPGRKSTIPRGMDIRRPAPARRSLRLPGTQSRGEGKVPSPFKTMSHAQIKFKLRSRPPPAPIGGLRSGGPLIGPPRLSLTRRAT